MITEQQRYGAHHHIAIRNGRCIINAGIRPVVEVYAIANYHFMAWTSQCRSHWRMTPDRVERTLRALGFNS